MVRTRQAKVDGIAREHRRRWRSTTPSGAAPRAGARLGLDLRAHRRGLPSDPRKGGAVAQAHLRHLNPFPANIGEVLRSYDRVLVPEMNLGQLALLLRGQVPGRRHRLQPGPRAAVQGRRARRRHRGRDRQCLRLIRGAPSTWASPDLPASPRPTRSSRPRTSRPTRRCAGAPAAVTTRSSPPSRASCPSSACPREHRLRLRHRLLLALPVLHEHLRDALDPRPRAGDRDRPGRPPARTCRSGSSPATATRCRSAATT